MNVAVTHFDGQVLNWYCPGCKRRHGATLKGDYVWEWNGSLESPTLTPSVLTNHIQDPTNVEWNKTHRRCHSFVRAGRIQFLDDCEHELAGQTVDMVPWVPGPRDGRP